MTSLLGRVRGAWSAFNEEPAKDTTGTTQQFGHFSGGTPPFANYRAYRQDRKSAVQGTRVDRGGRRIIKKNIPARPRVTPTTPPT